MRTTGSSRNRVRGTFAWALVVLALLSGRGLAQEKTPAAEFRSELAVDQWIDVGGEIGPAKIVRWRLSEAATSRHVSHRSGEEQRSFDLELQYTMSSDRAWLAEVEVSWIDAQGQTIGTSNAYRLLAKNATEDRRAQAQRQGGFEPFSVPLVASVYGLSHAKQLIVRVRLDADLPQLLHGHLVTPEVEFLPEGIFEPVGQPPYGRDWWRYFECGFGLPPLCDVCNRRGLGCYEVATTIIGTEVHFEPYCSVPSEARDNALTTCRLRSISPGFFCHSSNFRIAKLRHTCGYPHMRYPYPPIDRPD